MTPDEKRELKNKITKEIENTNKEIERLKKACKPISPDNAIGRITRMDAIHNKSITEAALFQTESKLNNLELVLTNADNENFGTCTICGNTIPIERLMFMPESTKCINCAA